MWFLFYFLFKRKSNCYKIGKLRKLHQQSWEISKQSHRLQTTRLKLPHTRLTWTKTKNKNRKKTKKATDIKPYWRNYYHRTQRASFSWLSVFRFTAWKVSVFGVFLVRIFPHLDWIRRDISYLSIFSPNSGKCGAEKLRIWARFTQWFLNRWLTQIELCETRRWILTNYGAFDNVTWSIY